MNLDDLQSMLPNGLHDSQLIGLQVDYRDRQAEFDILIWIGSLEAKLESEREGYRAARLMFRGLQFLVIDPPDRGYESSELSWIDAGSGQPSTSPSNLPPLDSGKFLCWMFVAQWNSFIRIAAGDVSLHWNQS